jgi:hypothetical protein
MLDIHLQNEEQKVINAIYDYFRSTGKWPGARSFRKELGKVLVESVLGQHKLQLAEKFEDDRVEHYRLTFRGFLVCPSAKGDIQILLRYLNLLKLKFEKNPEIREITSREVEEALELSKEESKRLSVLIDLGHLWSGSASRGENEWTIGVPNDIEELIESEGLEKYLIDRLEKEEKWQKEYEKIYFRLDKFRILSWLSFNTNLWLASYIAFSFSKKSLPITIFVVLWFTLYSISKVSEDIFKKRVPFFSAEKLLEKLIWWIITIIVSGAAGIITKLLSS